MPANSLVKLSVLVEDLFESAASLSSLSLWVQPSPWERTWEVGSLGKLNEGVLEVVVHKSSNVDGKRHYVQ